MKKLEQAFKRITVDDLFDFFLGALYLPVVLFLGAFGISMAEYALFGNPPSEGEAIIAVSISAGAWAILTKHIEIKKNPSSRKTNGLWYGMISVLFLSVSLYIARIVFS